MQELKLSRGRHWGPRFGACAMEAVSLVAGERWSDYPKCACPVISNYVRGLNDTVPDELRPQLTPYIPRLVGTRANKTIELERCFLMGDFMAHRIAPLSLRAASIEERAVKFEGLEKIYDKESTTRARKQVSYHFWERAKFGTQASDQVGVALRVLGSSPGMVPSFAIQSIIESVKQFKSWTPIFPLALELLDDLINLGPGGNVPDDWFERAKIAIPVSTF